MAKRKFASISVVELHQGRILKAGRVLAGLSQGQLAEAASVHRKSVQYWEARPLLAVQSWGLDRLINALEGLGIHFTSSDGGAESQISGVEFSEPLTERPFVKLDVTIAPQGQLSEGLPHYLDRIPG